MSLVLLIVFVLVMGLWAFFINDPRAKWLPWVAVFILGLVVFLFGFGVITVDRNLVR